MLKRSTCNPIVIFDLNELMKTIIPEELHVAVSLLWLFFIDWKDKSCLEVRPKIYIKYII